MTASSSDPTGAARGPATAGTPTAAVPPARRRVIDVLRSPWTRLTVLVVLVGVGASLVLVADDLSVAGIRAVVDGLGVWAPLVYVGLYVLATVFLLPGTPFTVAAGVVFGPWLGLGVVLLGATLGATGSFLVGRVVGRDAVVQLAGRRVRAIDRTLERNGLLSVLVVRLIPLFPFNVLNLVCGVTGLKLRDYVIGTAVGIIPGTALLVLAGGSIDDPTSPMFVGSVAGFVALAVVTGLIARRMRPSDATVDASDATVTDVTATDTDEVGVADAGGDPGSDDA